MKIYSNAEFRVYHLEQYLSLDYIKASQGQFAALNDQHHLLVVGAYFLIYVVVTALSLPGATVLALAGGVLFGFWTGTVKLFWLDVLFEKLHKI